MKKILLMLAVIMLTACAGSPARRLITQQADCPEGYEFVSQSKNGHKWCIAPASKDSILLESINPLTGKIEANKFTSVSVFIAYPHPNAERVEYSVEAFACELTPGTFAKQASDNRGWDNKYTTEAYGTMRWKIWKKVCNK